MSYKLDSKNIIKIGIALGLVIVSGFLKINIPFLPVTLLIAFIIFNALYFDKIVSRYSIILYVVLGLIGFPVFANGGGFAYVFKPSFGFIIGYIVCTLFISGFKDRINLYLSVFIGLILLYIVGGIYMFIMLDYLLGMTLTLFVTNILYLGGLFVKDIFLCLISILLYKRLVNYKYKSN